MPYKRYGKIYSVARPGTTKRSMMKEQHVGSDFDEFLEEEGLLEETEAVVTKRLLAHEIAQAIEEQTDQVNYGGSQ